MYEKQFGQLLVTVYAMRVSGMDEVWMEQDFRERRWFGVEQALSLIGRKQLEPLITKLARMLDGGR